jgi:hypothetical protein
VLDCQRGALLKEFLTKLRFGVVRADVYVALYVWPGVPHGIVNKTPLKGSSIDLYCHRDGNDKSVAVGNLWDTGGIKASGFDIVIDLDRGNGSELETIVVEYLKTCEQLVPRVVKHEIARAV